MAYLGLVPSEYSSGEAQRHGALIKAGNSHARGESWSKAAWHYRQRPTLGRAPVKPGATRRDRQPRVASVTALALPLSSSRRLRQANAGGDGGDRARTRGVRRAAMTR